MRTLLTVITLLGFLAVPSLLIAAEGGGKGPSSQAYKNANENASFKGKGSYDKKGKTGKELKKELSVDEKKKQQKTKDVDMDKSKQTQKQKQKQKGRSATDISEAAEKISK